MKKHSKHLRIIIKMLLSEYTSLSIIDQFLTEQQREGPGHFVLITNEEALTAPLRSKHVGNRYVHDQCGKGFSSIKALESHKKCCGDIINNVHHILPEEGTLVKFNKFREQMRVPFRIYADIESMIVKREDSTGDKVKKIADHIPSSSAFVIIDDTGRVEYHYQVSDENTSCIDRMINDLNKIHIDCLDRIHNHKTYAPDYRIKRKEKTITPEELKELDKWESIHYSKTACDICFRSVKQYCKSCKSNYYEIQRYNNEIDRNKKTDKKKEFIPCKSCISNKADGLLVYDHDHITGKYRCTACNNCNLNYFKLSVWSYLSTVFFHNGEGYDFHFIIKSLLKSEGKLHPDIIAEMHKILKNEDLVNHITTKNDINCIARSGEKFLTVKTGLLDFKDSCKLLLRKLDELIYNLVWIETVCCKQCKSTISYPKNITHDKTHFIGEFVCRSCKQYGHIIPNQIVRINKKYIYKNLKAMSHIAIVDGVVNDDRLALLLRKGEYPYSYMDSFQKFTEGPPPIEAFYDELRKEKCHEDDYNHFVKVYRTFECKNMRDLEKIYLLTDVGGLADVMENNSAISMKNFGLDAAHFITNSSLADASQKLVNYKKDIEMKENRILNKPFSDDTMCMMKGKENLTMNEWVMNMFPELLTSKATYDLFTSKIKGGLCNAVKHYSRAYNEFVPGYDVKKVPILLNHLTGKMEPMKTYITYLDATSMYPGIMRHKLPVGDFKDIVEGDIQFKKLSDMNELKDMDTEGYIGYAYLVDYYTPEELHDYMNDLPLGCENRSISIDELSEEQLRIRETFGESKTKTESYLASSKRLICTLGQVNDQLVHFKLLKFMINKGLKVTKVHKIIEFRQAEYLKDFIDIGAELRKNAKTDAESALIKNMINSDYGKQMENVYGRLDLRFMKDCEENSKKISKIISSPLFKNHHAMGEYIQSKENENEFIHQGYLALTSRNITVITLN